MIIDHIAIRADDIKKVASWYQESINAEITHVDSFYIRLSTENNTIAIIDKNRYPQNHVGILVDNLDDLPQNGRRVEHRDGTVGVYCQDPEGNCVEFIYYTEDLKSEFLTYANTATNIK